MKPIIEENMSKIKFYKYEDIRGKVKVGEALEFGSNIKALSQTEPSRHPDCIHRVNG